MFKLWSEIKKEAKEELRPDFGFRSWNDLSLDDKQRMWSFLWERWFFNPRVSGLDAFFSFEKYTDDSQRDKTIKFKRILYTLDFLNTKYKAKTYARSFLDNRSIDVGLNDFYKSIYLSETENVVFELLSMYAKKIILEKEDGLKKKDDELEEEFKKRDEEYRWKEFDEFAIDLNEVFGQFGIKYYLTRSGFVPEQDERIMVDIYEPVLNYLSDNKWEEVNSLLVDAFD